MYYYNARYYDPHLGRFIQPDTLVPDPLSPQAWNRFSYVYNNPTSYVDPSGHGVPAIVLVAAVGFLAGEIYAGTQGYTPLDAEFWSYSIGGAATFTYGYFLATDLLLVAGIGIQEAGLWAGSTTLFRWGLRATSFGARIYTWAFQPLDFSSWRLRRGASTNYLRISQIRFTQSEVSPEFGKGPWKGMTIPEVAEAVRSGTITFDHPMEVFLKTPEMDAWPMTIYTTASGKMYTGSYANLQNGQIYTLNNRGFTTAILAGLDEVPVTWASASRIVELSYQFDTPNFGTSVLLRGYNLTISVPGQ